MGILTQGIGVCRFRIAPVTDVSYRICVSLFREAWALRLLEQAGTQITGIFALLHPSFKAPTPTLPPPSTPPPAH